MEYTLIRSKSRRHSLALRITSKGEIVIRSPLWTPKFVIDRFVRSKSVWIKQQLIKHTHSAPPRHFTILSLKAYIYQQVAHYSRELGLSPAGVRFKHVKSYWGNCSIKGVLSFNLSLAFAPPAAVTYVVVHELSHLKYKNHGRRFWALVHQTYPNASQMRKILRQIHYT